MLLASRVRDAEVRGFVESLRGELSKVGFARDESEANARIFGAADIQMTLIHRIGQLLRELDEAE